MVSADIDPQLALVIGRALGLDGVEIGLNSGEDVTEGWDSFGQLRIVLEVEFEYGIQFDSSRIPDLNTAGLIQDELRRLIAAASVPQIDS